MANPTSRQVLSYAAGLALVAGLTACGGSPSTDGASTSQPLSPTASSTSSVPTQAPTAASSRTAATGPGEVPPSSGRTLTITVRGKQVTPPPSTVPLEVGETLTLVVTSDHADELHVHGFDIEEELAAGQPVTVRLTGKQPGTYEVETHHPELRLLKIAVR